MEINSESHTRHVCFQFQAAAPSRQSHHSLLSSPGTTLRFLCHPSIHFTNTSCLLPKHIDSSMSSSSRIHPSSSSNAAVRGHGARRHRAAHPTVYTVWKRSSMGFQGTDGFSVYDAAGHLAFRVDNYSRRHKLCAGELLLMDGQGTPLMSLRPQVTTFYNFTCLSSFCCSSSA
jgi:hypothetical protein